MFGRTGTESWLGSLVLYLKTSHDHLAALGQHLVYNWPQFSILTKEIQINTFLLRLLENLVFLVKNEREDDLWAWITVMMLGGTAAFLRPRGHSKRTKDNMLRVIKNEKKDPGLYRYIQVTPSDHLPLDFLLSEEN